MSAAGFACTAMVLGRAASVHETALAVGALLIMVGLALHLRTGRHVMLVEEKLKDGRLSEKAALRQIRVSAFAGRAFTVSGVVVLLVGFVGYLQ